MTNEKLERCTDLLNSAYEIDWKEAVKELSEKEFIQIANKAIKKYVNRKVNGRLKSSTKDYFYFEFTKFKLPFNGYIKEAIYVDFETVDRCFAVENGEMVIDVNDDKDEVEKEDYQVVIKRSYFTGVEEKSSLCADCVYGVDVDTKEGYYRYRVFCNATKKVSYTLKGEEARKKIDSFLTKGLEEDIKNIKKGLIERYREIKYPKPEKIISAQKRKNLKKLLENIKKLEK